jgi:hypothetical protein
MLIRERLSKETGEMVEEVKQLEDFVKWKSILRQARTWAKAVLNM